MFTKDRVVRTTQHIKNIKTLSEDANLQLIRDMNENHEPRFSEETIDNSSDDCGHREELISDSKKLKKRGKRGQRKNKTKNEDLGTKPRMGMDARYGETKSPPRERIGAIYRVDQNNRSEAMKSANRVDWEHAAESEIVSLKAIPLRTKSVLKTKTDADGNVERYKASMVACGNEQAFCENYTLIFTTVTIMTTTHATWTRFSQKKTSSEKHR
uniref:AlNc14C317G10549 protein n=1 Tax=Albugo laibachii Nc14 TaxID=890382 RepID=F0WWB4_9STRA|nr:AlNc14C317G10549 [Albugo laibachii Nc14]|eukprot:CCA25734.1 AlNc14C317G10549 [Albugo laibachii Nc14]